MPSRLFLENFLQHAESSGEQAALYWNGSDFTYREIARRARRAAAEIERLGGDRAAPVCVLAKKSPETLALVIGCWLAGRSVLLPSPELGTSVLEQLLATAGCRHVLVPEGEPGSVSVRTVEPRKDVTPHTARSDTLLMLTTSGSTGVPKIVPLDPDGVQRFLAWACDRFDIGAGTTVLSFAPLNFDLSLLDVWATLYAGGCVALVDPERAADGHHLAEVLEAGRVDVVQAVPVFYRLLRDAVPFGCSFPARHVILTGDATSPRLLAELPALFPKARVYNVYGCTETNDSFLHEVDSFELAPGERLPIGRPIAGVDALLLDEEGRPVEGAGTGELVVRTPFQAAGYLDARLDVGRFVPGPDGSTYYRTGDVVRRTADGVYVLEGRNDYHVKVRGVRTNLQEVEHVLQLHPQVLEVAVVAMPDEVFGNLLHAKVRRSPNSGLNSLHLRRYCSAHLPKSAIPSTVEITDQPLPKTSTGKVDRNAVKAALVKGR